MLIIFVICELLTVFLLLLFPHHVCDIAVGPLEPISKPLYVVFKLVRALIKIVEGIKPKEQVDRTVA